MCSFHNKAEVNCPETRWHMYTDPQWGEKADFDKTTPLGSVSNKKQGNQVS